MEELQNRLQNRKLKILVADDQRVNLDVIRMNMEQMTLLKDLEFFTDGQQVIDRIMEILEMRDLASCPIDALLLDFQMPVKNGIQVVREVKTLYAKQNTKNPELTLKEPLYVFFTAHAANKQFREHSYASGVDYVLEKPIAAVTLEMIMGRL